MHSNSKGPFFDHHLFFACVSLWIVTYGTLIVAIELTNFWAFFFVLGAVLITYVGIKQYSLKPSEEDVVKEIIGVDFRLESEKAKEAVNNILNNGGSKKNDDEELILKVIAHRFAGIDAPENSVVALEKCYQRGCTAVEFDVALTADKVPIVFHDNTVDRLTNTVGEINKMTWDKLRTLDISASHPFHEKFEGTRVALLEEVLEKCLEYDMRMFIDVKDPSQEMVDVICELFDKWPRLYKRAIISSFNPWVVYSVREKRPGATGSMAWRPYYFSHSGYPTTSKDSRPYYNSLPAYLFTRAADLVTTWLFNNVYYIFCGLSVVLIHKDTITSELIARWESRGVRVIAWTVNMPSEKVHLSRNLEIPYMTDTMSGD